MFDIAFLSRGSCKENVISRFDFFELANCSVDDLWFKMLNGKYNRHNILVIQLLWLRLCAKGYIINKDGVSEIDELRIHDDRVC